MSLPDPLVLKDSTLTDVTFSIQTILPTKDANSGGSIRVDTASGATTPRNFVIKQSITGKGTSRVRRTLVQVTQVKLDSAGNSSQLTHNLSWVYPLNGIFSATDLYNAICIAADAVLSTASLAVDTTKVSALLQGQS